MKRIWIFMFLIACPVTTFGQGNGLGLDMQGSTAGSSGSPPYQPAMPVSSAAVNGGGGSSYGAYGGYDSGQSPEGAALQGLSQVISSAGQYNLATSAAAVNLSQAKSNEVRNKVQAARAYWEIRNLARLGREKERGPRPTPEELSRRAHAAAPRRLSAQQIDLVSGTLFWPVVLQDASFAARRTALSEYTARWLKYGGLDYADQAQVRENIDAMFDVLKSQIASIPPQDYVESRVFLQSLKVATTHSVL